MQVLIPTAAPRSRRAYSLVAATVAAVLACGVASNVRATSLTWDANTGVGGAQNGAGTWKTSNNNWWDGAANVSWNNATPDQATFGSTAYTVTLGETITANKVGTGYGGAGVFVTVAGDVGGL